MTLLDNVLAKHTDLQVVIVPSLRDAHHEFVYPQPPFNKKKACEAFESSEYTKVWWNSRSLRQYDSLITDL